MSIRVGVVTGAATRELRREVLRPGWPDRSPMHGDDNPDAVHLAALADDGRVIGACLLLPRPYPNRPDEPGSWQLRGMATAPPLQGQGIGALVLAGALGEIERRGGRMVWCEARTSAVAFYRQHGFVVDGCEFEHTESGLPHQRMWRPVPATD